jgi:hypothetical protein
MLDVHYFYAVTIFASCIMPGFSAFATERDGPLCAAVFSVSRCKLFEHKIFLKGHQGDDI